jgi:hypothetical protein
MDKMTELVNKRLQVAFQDHGDLQYKAEAIDVYHVKTTVLPDGPHLGWIVKTIEASSEYVVDGERVEHVILRVDIDTVNEDVQVLEIWWSSEQSEEVFECNVKRYIADDMHASDMDTVALLLAAKWVEILTTRT